MPLASVLLTLLGAAHADTITLDTGAAIQGDLARFEFGGDCQISVTEGDLAGVIIIVPCQRVESFARTGQRMPSAIGVTEPDGATTVRGNGESAVATAPAAILPVATVGSVVVAPSGRAPPENARLPGSSGAAAAPTAALTTTAAPTPAAAPPASTPVAGALAVSPVTESPFDDDGFFDEDAAGAAIPVDSGPIGAPPAALQPRSAPSLTPEDTSSPRRTVQF